VPVAQPEPPGLGSSAVRVSAKALSSPSLLPSSSLCPPRSLCSSHTASLLPLQLTGLILPQGLCTSHCLDCCHSQMPLWLPLYPPHAASGAFPGHPI
jgi:hypothetical protein